MKKHLFIILSLFTLNFISAQDKSLNSETRNFIASAVFTQVNRDWSVTADFKSGIGEEITFFPVEIINLKSNKKLNALQMDMEVKYEMANKTYKYNKSSWIDILEVEEFIVFLETYVVPNIKDKTDKKTSTTYIFNSKEIIFTFFIEKNKRRISVYLKNYGITDFEHYFWTESQVDKIPELLEVLKTLK